MRRKEELLRELESLESSYEQKKISDKQYEAERNRIERNIVAIMDRLVQIGHFTRNS
jgi:hypothetical protein